MNVEIVDERVRRRLARLEADENVDTEALVREAADLWSRVDDDGRQCLRELVTRWQLDHLRGPR
ncbi:hypothetical protein [Antarcticirhabdus aurantiaca]|uniref:hypothetical protein n=1 Tax=Antarcticirhabdus aurantiaca TaxID=2606717 RepID=UPI00131B9F7B|nr:hypothetical protein [Antarcticirhabdus aurantiaca]